MSKRVWRWVKEHVLLNLQLRVSWSELVHSIDKDEQTLATIIQPSNLTTSAQGYQIAGARYLIDLAQIRFSFSCSTTTSAATNKHPYVALDQVQLITISHKYNSEIS